MKVFIIASFLLSLSIVQATLMLDALAASLILKKIAKVAKVPNLVKVDAEVHTNVLGNELGVDAAYGIGEKGSSAHASVNGDVLGQNDNVHADIYDGYDSHRKDVYKDENGRHFILVPQYYGTNMVYARKYLTDADVDMYRMKQNGKTFEIDFDSNNRRISLHEKPATPDKELETINVQGHVPRITQDSGAPNTYEDRFKYRN